MDQHAMPQDAIALTTSFKPNSFTNYQAFGNPTMTVAQALDEALLIAGYMDRLCVDIDLVNPPGSSQ